jgi:tRNA (adenine57-N1/adenine58-N1)-methyltransferase
LSERRLADADRVLLIDNKGRQYLVTLSSGSAFHSHNGLVDHDDLIGRREGALVETTQGSRFRVLRPTLSDFVLKMKRGAQVIYPKETSSRGPGSSSPASARAPCR